MKFKRTLIIAALAACGLFAGNLASLAQDAANAKPAGPPPGRQHMRGGMNLDRLTKELKLTDEQKPKVKSILEAERQKMRDLRSDTNVSRADRRTKMRTIREDTMKKMKDVLTPEQFDKYQHMFQRGRRNARANNPKQN